MSELALPGDTWDIDLNCDVKTLPTVGPLFGSYKVQLDVFECPIRLYQGKLHMNMINIGMDMKNIKLPQYELVGRYEPDVLEDENLDHDNMYVSPSAIYSYLNVRGLGRTDDGDAGGVKRQFNAVPLLGYWEIYANYYANKQEGDKFGEAEGVVIHSSDPSNEWGFGNLRLETTSGSGTPLGPITVVPGGSTQSLYMNGFTEGQIQCVWDNGTIRTEI